MQSEIKEALLRPSSSVPECFDRSGAGVLAERFAIYRNNLYSSLLESLQAVFPVLEQLVGKASFKALALDFIKQHSPESPCLFEYGAQMAAFIKHSYRFSAQPYLSDVARLEYSILQSTHAADCNIQADILVKLSTDPDALDVARFYFSPATQLIQFEYAAASIWQAHQYQDCHERLAQINVNIHEAVLVSRPMYQPLVQILTAEEARLLELMISGMHLSRALDKAPVDNLASVFQYLISGGCLVGLRSD